MIFKKSLQFLCPNCHKMNPFKHFPKLCLSLAFISIVQQSTCYEIDPKLKFSEVVERIPIASHFANLTVYHPLFEAIARQTISEEKFMALTQQDHLYIDNFLHVFRILAKKETDPGRKAQLQKIGDENWEKYWNSFYDKFNFTKPAQFVPTMLRYAAAELRAAKYDDIAVALATVYPCMTLWVKMGEHIAPIADLSNNPDHLYKEFIEGNSYGGNPNFTDLVDGYYLRLGNDTKTKQLMFNAYIRSAHHEFAFLEYSYHYAHIEREPSPKFTDLVESFVEFKDFQSDVVHHKLFKEIASGSLPLEVYAVLIQQKRILLNAVVASFSFMERKETDTERKLRLRNDFSGVFKFFQGQFDKYNFKPASFVDGYARGYVEHIMTLAEHKSIAQGMAAVYPFHFLWAKMGKQISPIGNITENYPYQDFIQFYVDDTGLEAVESLLNGYFDRLGDDLESKDEMFRIVEKSTMFEIMFANGVYKMGKFQ